MDKEKLPRPTDVTDEKSNPGETVYRHWVDPKKASTEIDGLSVSSEEQDKKDEELLSKSQPAATDTSEPSTESHQEEDDLPPVFKQQPLGIIKLGTLGEALGSEAARAFFKKNPPQRSITRRRNRRLYR